MNDLALKPVMGRPKKENVPVEKKEERLVDVGFEIDPEKDYIFETIKKSPNPRHEVLASTCRIFDTEEKRYRDIIYIPTAPSIFKEDLDESWDAIPSPPLFFYRDQLIIHGQDKRGMEYVMMHSDYEFSPFKVSGRQPKFTLVDKEVQEKIKAKIHEAQFKAQEAIKKLPIEDLRPIARVVFGVTEIADTAIVNKMNEIAKSDKKGTGKLPAEQILENIGNPELVRRYNIQSGIDNGLVFIDTNTSQARFRENNVFILQLKSRDYVKELVDFSNTGEGMEFYNQLKKKMN